jgi:hypothetical protein
MCPSGWSIRFSQKSIYAKDCEKLFKTKHLAKYITSSLVLLEALKSISTASKRIDLIERVHTQMGADVFFDENEQISHDLNAYLCDEFKRLVTNCEENVATSITTLLKVMDHQLLLQKIDNATLKSLFNSAFFKVLLESFISNEQSFLCLRLAKAVDADKSFSQALFTKDGAAHGLLIDTLKSQATSKAHKAELLIALLRTKDGHKFIFTHRQDLLPQLSPEVVAHQNDNGESVLLYLIADYWMYLPFSNTNLFVCLDKEAVYREATEGPNCHKSIASKLVDCGHSLAISLLLMHDAVLLSKLSASSATHILSGYPNKIELLSHLTTAMGSLQAFKHIEQCLFATHHMDLLWHELSQKAIAKLYLQMEQSDVVFSKDDRMLLMQYMNGIALNYKDKYGKTPVTYLVKYKEGRKHFSQRADIRESISEETLGLLDEDDRDFFAGFEQQSVAKLV